MDAFNQIKDHQYERFFASSQQNKVLLLGLAYFGKQAKAFQEISTLGD